MYDFKQFVRKNILSLPPASNQFIYSRYMTRLHEFIHLFIHIFIFSLINPYFTNYLYLHIKLYVQNKILWVKLLFWIIVFNIYVSVRIHLWIKILCCNKPIILSPCCFPPSPPPPHLSPLNVYTLPSPSTLPHMLTS